MAAGLSAVLTLGAAANAGQTPLDKLKLRVVTDKKTYTATAPIKMTFTIKNTGAKPITLTYGDGKRYDFKIFTGKHTSAPSEGALWHWSKNLSFTQEVGAETLGAGKIFTHTETFKSGMPTIPALKPGTYTLFAYSALMTRDPLSSLTTFKIVAAK